jgi:SAM-dependent methyltransferase
VDARPAAGEGVAPDGSPVAVFRRLPAEPAISYVTAAIGRGADVLDLGCGAGRLAHALVARGHRVVAVDQSPPMLACVEGCETVLAEVAGLDLGRRFAAVVLASYLINHPTLGEAHLSCCGRHLADGGAVVVQRYDPVWARSGAGGSAVVGEVGISVGDRVCSGGRFRATVSYAVGGERWEQPVEAAVVDDDRLDRMAAGAGLAVDRWLDQFRTWVRLVRAGEG